jgi:hypothetical protein
MRHFAAASLAVGALVTGLGSAGAGGGASLRVTKFAPLTVRGTGFHPRSRLRVTASAGKTSTHFLRAGASGSFTTVFRGLNVGTCEAFTVRAEGDGTLAVVKRGRPVCGAEIAP